MSKHTPGPWVATFYSGEVSVDSPCGRNLFFVSRDCDDDAEADALLIASAPDLLEALKRLESAYKTSHSSKTRADCWAQAYAVIARATGETP